MISFIFIIIISISCFDSDLFKGKKEAAGAMYFAHANTSNIK